MVEIVTDVSKAQKDVEIEKLTNDKDLVELGGYHAYRSYKVRDQIDVNDKSYLVINTSYNTESGLDALTVRNIDTDEITIVYVGSQQIDKDWIGTNMKLLSNIPPNQITDAKEYYLKMTEKYGEVSSITGNSLGGALTNAVAIDHPDVKAVTLNSAILPPGMVDPTKEHANITNYYSQFDFLTNSQKTLGIDDRIPGNKYHINNGLPLFSLLGSNHTGYVDQDQEGNFKVEIGIKGEPGHGFIHIGADDHIITSVWTGMPIYGGSSVNIKINKHNLTSLANGINNNVTNRLNLASGYLDNSVSIVDDESDKFSMRVTTLQETFSTMLNELAGNKLFNGIAGTGIILKKAIDGLIDLLDFAEDKCRNLNYILNSPPVEIMEFISKVDISVESLFGGPKRLLEDLKTDIDHLIAGANDIINKHIPELFRGGTDFFIDSVVGEFSAHYAIILENKNKLLGQLTDYEQQVRDIAQVFGKSDDGLSAAIMTGNAPIKDASTIQKTNVFTLKPSPYLGLKKKIKDLQVEIAHSQIKSTTTTILIPILGMVDLVLILIEKGLESIIHAIDAAANIVVWNPIGLIMSLFSDFRERVRQAAENAIEPIVEMEATVEGLVEGVSRLIMNLPGMLDDFKPYIDTAIFEPGRMSDVTMYNIASSSILDEMELLFSDIVNGLSNEQAESITAALNVSESILGNIEILNEQVSH